MVSKRQLLSIGHWVAKGPSCLVLGDEDEDIATQTVADRVSSIYIRSAFTFCSMSLYIREDTDFVVRSFMWNSEKDLRVLDSGGRIQISSEIMYRTAAPGTRQQIVETVRIAIQGIDQQLSSSESDTPALSRNTTDQDGFLVCTVEVGPSSTRDTSSLVSFEAVSEESIRKTFTSVEGNTSLIDSPEKRLCELYFLEPMMEPLRLTMHELRELPISLEGRVY